MPEQSMEIVATDKGGRFTKVDFRVDIRQTAAPPIFIRLPPSNFKIFENLSDDHIITTIKVV